MDDRIIYMETGSLNPYYNLAFEDYILSHRTQACYLLLWQNDNTIVIGQNQNAEEEINRAFVEKHHIRVARRSTGGGAVYHDLGNLNYSFITDAWDSGCTATSRFTALVVHALQGLGLQAEASGRNDILINGFKVSGTAQRLHRGRVLHHGTLLFDINVDIAAGALHVDPQKFRSKSIKSVRSRIGNIRDFLKEDMDMPAFWRYLKVALSDGDLVQGSLTSQELDGVENLQKDKYDTWEWNFGRSPRYDVVSKRYWSGGCLEIQMAVKRGRIAEIALYGDFMAVCSIDPVKIALQGCPVERNALEEALAPLHLELYLGSITKEEVIETILHIS